MWSNVAYFSTWRTHGNRVSKTRFPTYTYQRKTHPEHIREEPREGIKKKKNRIENLEKEEKKKSKQREKNPDQRKERESGESSQLTSPVRPGLARLGAGVAWARAQKQVACDPGRRRPRLRGLGCAVWVVGYPSRTSPGSRQAT